MQTHLDPLGDVTNPDAHANAVGAMFSRMASRYDLQNHLFSLGQDFWWRHNLVQNVVPGPSGIVLDLAAGTLDVSLSVARRYHHVSVMALDISAEMMEYGMQNKVRAGEKNRISTLVADARSLPLADNYCDAVTMAFGLRNVLPRADALAEIHRVLIPGGRVCILEFSPLTTPVFAQLYRWYMEKILTKLAGLISDSTPAFEYFIKSIMAFPSPPEFCRELLEAGFPFVQHRAFTLGIANLYVGIKA